MLSVKLLLVVFDRAYDLSLTSTRSQYWFGVSTDFITTAMTKAITTDMTVACDMNLLKHVSCWAIDLHE